MGFRLAYKKQEKRSMATKTVHFLIPLFTQLSTYIEVFDKIQEDFLLGGV